jgi:hypothetical protein
MTVLSFQWLLGRPRPLTRRRLPARPRRRGGAIRSRRRTYADSFFADPNAVEDDYRRMRPGSRLR